MGIRSSWDFLVLLCLVCNNLLSFFLLPFQHLLLHLVFKSPYQVVGGGGVQIFFFSRKCGKAFCVSPPMVSNGPIITLIASSRLEGKNIVHVGWLRNLVNVIVVPFELVLMSFKGVGESLVIKGDE